MKRNFQEISIIKNLNKKSSNNSQNITFQDNNDRTEIEAFDSIYQNSQYKDIQNKHQPYPEPEADLSFVDRESKHLNPIYSKVDLKPDLSKMLSMSSIPALQNLQNQQKMHQNLHLVGLNLQQQANIVDHTKFDEESRSIYVGHLPEAANYYDLCKVANPFGQLELVRLVPKKKCAFLNFVNIESARAMMAKYVDSCVPKPEEETGENALFILSKPVRLSWSKTNALSDEINTAISDLGATRNLFVFYGNCMGFKGAQPMQIQEMETVFRKFGHIENIVIKAKKYIAFVNMTSINSALQAYKASEDTLGGSGLLLRGEKLVVKFSTDNDQNYSSERNNPRNQLAMMNVLMGPNGTVGGFHNQMNMGMNSNMNMNANNMHPLGMNMAVPIPQEPPLPPGWMESYDDASGCKYYYNTRLSITQWEHPVTGKASPPNKTPPFSRQQAAGAGGERSNSRAIIIGNLPAHVTYAQICTLARQHGMIESTRLHPGSVGSNPPHENDEQVANSLNVNGVSGSSSSCVAFVNFVDPASAASLFYQAQQAPIIMDGNTLRVGWAKEVPIKPYLMQAIMQDGACRSLYLRDVTEAVTEQDVRDSFAEIAKGEIESVILMPNGKPFGFVNFIDIISAKKCVDFYRDHKNGVLKVNGVEMQVSYVNMSRKLSKTGVRSGPGNFGFANFNGINHNQNIHTNFNMNFPTGMQSMNARNMEQPHMHAAGSNACRSVIISGFPDDTTYSDIARLGNPHGAIESMHLSHEKNHAFINFINPESATTFVNKSQALNRDREGGVAGSSGYEIRGQKVRVGYGKSVPLRQDILIALQQDRASRSLYVGGLNCEDSVDGERKLKELFDPFCSGVYDSIVVQPEKKYAFVNFTSLQTAKKIIEEFKKGTLGGDSDLKVSYAK